MSMPSSRSSYLGLTALLVLALLGVAACSDDNPTAPENLPASHTVQQGGVFHAPGLESPEQNCTECHGSDLRGGDDGQPSCFRCHGQKWSPRATLEPAPQSVGDGFLLAAHASLR
jgi:hypothetical protein